MAESTHGRRSGGAATTRSKRRGPEASYRKLLDAMERRLVGRNVPAFEVTLPDGTWRRVGAPSEPAFRLDVSDDAGARALGRFDELGIAEAYVGGHIDIPFGLLQALSLRGYLADRHPLSSLWRFVRPWLVGQTNQNRQLVPRHYDHDPDLYLSFLDRRHRLYSQALFLDGGETLEEAAGNKLDYVLDACQVGPASRVLDVGAGWGALAEHAARRGAQVTMLTLSKGQTMFLDALTRDFPGARAHRVVLGDAYQYAPEECFDAAVLLGSMEHLADYPRLLSRLDRLVRRDGWIYMDFSAVTRKFDISTFTHRYVFEGNGTPVHLPQLVAALNRSPFELVELQNDRHSYFLTASRWAERLEQSQAKVTAACGESVYRLFRLYLWATACSLGTDGSLESYRLVARKSRGGPSQRIASAVRQRLRPGCAG